MAEDNRLGLFRRLSASLKREPEPTKRKTTQYLNVGPSEKLIEKRKLRGDIELPNETGTTDITKDTGNSRTGPLPPYYYRTGTHYIKGGDFLANVKKKK